MIPIAISYPRSRWDRLCKVSDALNKFPWQFRVPQLNGGKRKSTIHKMRMTVNKSGHDETSPGNFYHLGTFAFPFKYVLHGPNSSNGVTHYGKAISPGLVVIARPDFSKHNHVGNGPLFRTRAHRACSGKNDNQSHLSLGFCR